MPRTDISRSWSPSTNRRTVYAGKLVTNNRVDRYENSYVMKPLRAGISIMNDKQNAGVPYDCSASCGIFASGVWL